MPTPKRLSNSGHISSRLTINKLGCSKNVSPRLGARGIWCALIERLLASTQAPLASGDEIWFLSGTRTPFALRKEVGAADEYSPQGDCFVLDHMFGEAFEGDRYGLLADREKNQACVNRQCTPYHTTFPRQ